MYTCICKHVDKIQHHLKIMLVFNYYYSDNQMQALNIIQVANN